MGCECTRMLGSAGRFVRGLTPRGSDGYDGGEDARCVMTHIGDMLARWREEPGDPGASEAGSLGASAPGVGVRVFRAGAKRRHEALGVLLTGQAGTGGAVVEGFLNFAAEYRLNLDDIWLAQRVAKGSGGDEVDDAASGGPGAAGGQGDSGGIIAATLVVPCAGRTAMVFLSPMSRSDSVPVVARLLETACGALSRDDVAVVQMLLDPGQDLPARALGLADFKRLAGLLYLQNTLKEKPSPVEALEGWCDWKRRPAMSTWREGPAELFERAILASYVETLDCPGLLGLREIGDIIAGHMATGRFDPDHWFVWCEGDEPVGVMLLNELPARQALELVYLGLTPAYRGRGLARRMLRQGMAAAWRQGTRMMVCAVDQDNGPAVKLYRSMGFVATGRKVAYVRVLAGGIES